MENTQSSNQFLKRTLITLLNICLILVIVIIGVVILGFTMPYLMPNLTMVMIRADSTLFWYMSRGSAIIGFIFLWLSTTMGLLVTTRAGKTWPGMKISTELHHYVSLLGLFFTGFHLIMLLGDGYLQPTLSQLLTPFALMNYRPFFVGIGQLAFYLWVILVLSFSIKKIIGRKVWRGLHYMGFIAFFFGMAHGISSGSDTALPWMQVIYLFSAASVLFLTFYRILVGTSAVKQQTGIERDLTNS